ncbi:SIS domain-containing protein [Paludibacterium paludis]|uniref:SIS domain-containing protein n=1 Tax=Paludibacterium paludis TaxID=1225769 RepID=A0A918UBS9_9NEIS|nr:SIS domain-containing protein [Paludibacterium paludis]GGY28010.1 hypothetical protein GCM10011289_34200 [Paludibacterium paludis]
MNAGTLALAAGQFGRVMAAIECAKDGEALGADEAIAETLAALRAVRGDGGSVWIIGNGGSAAVASHIQNDLMNKDGIRSQVLHEPALLTCMSNDFGYDKAYARLVGHYARPGDMLIAISSSGRSPNILAAVAAARDHDVRIVTASGFDAANPLRAAGGISFWSPSHDYGEVELSHLFLLHYIADRLADPS